MIERRLSILLTAACFLLFTGPAQAESTQGVTRPPSPKVEMGQAGLTVSSADGLHVFRLRSWIQVCGRLAMGDTAAAPTDELRLRRLLIDLAFKTHPHLTFRLQSSFSGDRYMPRDVYVDYSPSRALQIRAGMTKTPLGLEYLRVPSDIPFLETGPATRLVPDRDIGVMVFGSLGPGLLTYQLGVFNGVPDGQSGGRDISREKDLVARLFVRPFGASEIDSLGGLGLGVAATWGKEQGSLSNTALPRYGTAGGRQLFGYVADGSEEGTALAEGARARLNLQGYYFLGGLELMGEYTFTRQELRYGADDHDLVHRAWIGQVAYALWGARSYSAVVPRSDFDLEGGSGALEIKARAGGIMIDPAAFPDLAAPGSMVGSFELAAGLNWWLTRNARLMLEYVHTLVDAPEAGPSPPTEQVLMTAVQLGLR